MKWSPIKFRFNIWFGHLFTICHGAEWTEIKLFRYLTLVICRIIRVNQACHSFKCYFFSQYNFQLIAINRSILLNRCLNIKVNWIRKNILQIIVIISHGVYTMLNNTADFVLVLLASYYFCYSIIIFIWIVVIYMNYKRFVSSHIVISYAIDTVSFVSLYRYGYRNIVYSYTAICSIPNTSIIDLSVVINAISQ